MAKETAATLWSGTDFQYIFHILNDAETAAINISGWTLSWKVKRRRTHADVDAVLTKTPAIAGAYNADTSLNLQRATVSVEDVDTDSLTARTYVYELKRMDAGAETVLAYGDLELMQSVHRT
jgi:hypothetical protein